MELLLVYKDMVLLDIQLQNVILNESHLSTSYIPHAQPVGPISSLLLLQYSWKHQLYFGRLSEAVFMEYLKELQEELGMSFCCSLIKMY